MKNINLKISAVIKYYMSDIISTLIDINLYNEKIIKGNWINCKYNFNIFKNNNYKKNKQLLSVSLFLLPFVDEVYASQKNISLDELRIEHSQKVNGYLNGLNFIVTKVKDMNIRIFCDITSINLIEKYLTYNNVEIVYYYFEQFFNKDLNCHFGFFGTLMRYISLFNFKEFDNKWETVSIIDLENNFFNTKKFINNFTKNRSTINLTYWSRPCYYLSPRMFYMGHSINNFAIISSYLTQKNSQDKEVFINFLNNDLLGVEGEYDIVLRKYLDIDFGIRYFKGRLEYGVDEYFINRYFLGDCYLKKNLPFQVILSRDVSGGFLEWIKNIRFTYPVKTITNEEITRQFLELIVDCFFPEIEKIPNMHINEQINWVAERYYFLNLQFIHRKIDQTNKLKILHENLKLDKYKELDLYNEYLFGVELNYKLKNNSFGIFEINPEKSYPNFSHKLIEEILKN